MDDSVQWRIGTSSVSINRILIGPVRVLTAQQLGAWDLASVTSVAWVPQVMWDRYNFNISGGRLGEACLRAFLM